MMRNSLIQELTISSVLLVLLILFLDPFMIWMPGKIVMFLLFILVVVFCIFSIFIWREKARDEREMIHNMFAGRIAFLAGSAVLVGGIVYQCINHNLDVWLILAMGVMILGKIGGLIYSRIKH